MYFYSNNYETPLPSDVKYNLLTKKFDLHIEILLADSSKATVSFGSYDSIEEARLCGFKFRQLLEERKLLKVSQDIEKIKAFRDKVLSMINEDEIEVEDEEEGKFVSFDEEDKYSK